MNFVESTKTCLTKYATFSGRASRSEYWWFCLFTTIVKILSNIIDGVLISSAHAQEAVADMAMAPDAMVESPALPIVSLITGLVLFIPSLSAFARRLHDVNKSGWWMLISLTIIGLIPLLIWSVKKSDQGDNRFGPNPLAA